MKRSKDVIISQILDICAIGASKTKIVYQANLNFRTVNPYIELLSKNGLIEAAQGQTVYYKTTPKGIKILKEFRHIQNELPELYNSVAAGEGQQA
ncbi:MAG: winged helix-turn-helix domain-containing protein [Methanotrichaceae archaeon]